MRVELETHPQCKGLISNYIWKQFQVFHDRKEGKWIKDRGFRTLPQADLSGTASKGTSALASLFRWEDDVSLS